MCFEILSAGVYVDMLCGGSAEVCYCLVEVVVVVVVVVVVISVLQGDSGDSSTYKKLVLGQAMMAQRGSRGIVLLFL